MTQISSRPVRLVVKAIWRPSGDQKNKTLALSVPAIGLATVDASDLSQMREPVVESYATKASERPSAESLN